MPSLFQNPIFPVPGKGFFPFPTLPHGPGPLGCSWVNRCMLVLRPLFSGFFRSQKIIKKRTSQKTFFSWIWDDVWTPACTNLTILTSKNGPWEAILCAFSWSCFSTVFWSHFVEKMLNSEEWKSSFRYVNSGVLWRSPCCAKCERSQTKTNETTSFFGWEIY